MGPLRHILQYLDPGLDWPACRRVCSAWHECILLEETDLGCSLQLWMSDFICTHPTNPSSYFEAIQADRHLVRPTTQEERQRYIDYWNSELEEMGEDPLPSDHEVDDFQKWRRVDMEHDVFGLVNDGITDTKESIANGKIHFLCRNIYQLMNCDGLALGHEVERFPAEVNDAWLRSNELRSPLFVFAGAQYRAFIGVKRYSLPRNLVQYGFGIRVERCYSADVELPCPRRDVGDFECPIVDDDLPTYVRYKASFCTGAKIICKTDFPPIRWHGRHVQSSEQRGLGDGIHDEYIPLHVAQSALGPSSPNLWITLELEFVGYSFAV